MIGRDAELARLQAALDDLGPGLAPVFEVVGEPGIGKTRLIAELTARAHDRRHLVLSGQAPSSRRRSRSEWSWTPSTPTSALRTRAASRL